MADLTITSVPLGIRLVNENSDFTINEFSAKQNNVNRNELTIVSDLKDNYAEYKIVFADYDNVYLDGVVMADANVLHTALSLSTQNITQIGTVSDVNSSSTPLGADGTFLGTGIIVLNPGIIFVNVFSDVASAEDGLNIQQSSNGVNWDHDDKYTVPAGKGKNYSINPHSKFAKVDYTNGSTLQDEFRLQTIIKANSLESSHRIEDDIVDQDDARVVINIPKVQTNDKNKYANVSVQNPFPTDGDSTYGKDLDLSRIITTGWTGNVSNLFGDLTLGMVNSLGSSPKTLTIFFQRTIITNSMGLGANTGNFSNAKITALLSGGASFVLFDGSADSTLRTSQTIQFIPLGFVGIEIEFSTINTVTVTNVVILKSISTVSRQQALKPDGTVTNIDATAGGNLKVSVEELESGISVNGNSQLKTTLFDSSGNEIISPSQALLDSKGRLRHSNFMGTGYDQPFTIFDTKQIFDNNPQFWDDDQVSGAGTSSVHSVDKASSTLAVSITTAGVRTRQTFMCHNYQPAKVQHVIQTGTLIASGGGTGIKVYVGELNDDNGVAYFYDEGILKTLIRTKTSGSIVDNTESQASWDDPMGGSGRSGKTVDFTKGQIFGISYGWLGFDAVVFWLKIDAEVYVVNIMEGANLVNVPYMSTPNLPLRWSIENDGTGAASTTIHQCSTALSEGGQQDIGELRYLSTSGTHVTCAAENTVYAIIGMKLKAANLGASIKMIDIELATNTANGNFEWFLVFNPVVTGTFVYNDRTNSSIQAAIASGSGPTVTFNEQDVVTGGISMAGSGTVKIGQTEKGIENARRIGADIAGLADTLVLCVRPIMGATSVDIEGTTTRREIN